MAGASEHVDVLMIRIVSRAALRRVVGESHQLTRDEAPLAKQSAKREALKSTQRAPGGRRPPYISASPRFRF